MNGRQETLQGPSQHTSQSHDYSDREQIYAESLLWAHKLEGEQRNLENSLSNLKFLQLDEIKTLKGKVEDLSNEISSLKNRLSDFETGSSQHCRALNKLTLASVDGLGMQFKHLTDFCINWNNESKIRDRRLEQRMTQLQDQLDNLEIYGSKDIAPPEKGALYFHKSYQNPAQEARASSEVTTTCSDETTCIKNAHANAVTSQGLSFKKLSMAADRGGKDFEAYARRGVSDISEQLRVREVQLTKAFVQGLEHEDLRNFLWEKLEATGWTRTNAEREMERIWEHGEE